MMSRSPVSCRLPLSETRFGQISKPVVSSNGEAAILGVSSCRVVTDLGMGMRIWDWSLMANANASNDSPLIESSTMVPTTIATNHISPFGMNLTQTPSVKLDKNNFLLWKNMIMPIIKGHNLEGFILGTKKCPPEFIATRAVTNEGESVEMSPNLEYSRWTSTDQLLMGWLYSSMTPEIAMRVMGCSNSNKLWSAVNESYGILNRSRVTFLTGELQRTRKGSMSIDQYLTTVKQLVDNLEIAGKTITHEDLVTQVLAGLDEEYTPIVVQINSREIVSWYELTSMLMTFESRLEHLNVVRNGMSTMNISQVSANLAQRTGFNNNRTIKPNNYGKTSNFRGR
ncbi:Uncharacterized protein Adt_34369 [Abeliophyllum distichum]|uniref:Retrotransposon Copia-like N-terminal domain-containing protein n=1 Tax=Abeliophyllum distichum TaxID=126358 RepID=A0ABD1R0X9_9LAMI